MQNSDALSIEKPSLPGGGGSLNGMGESLRAAGPDGTASLTLPLPVSAGRGVAPQLALSYSSGAGNGPFALGWSCEPGAISVRTSQGVPQYQGADTYLGPDGEVLEPVADEPGNPVTRRADALLGRALSQPYRVTRWQPRILTGPVRLEFWEPEHAGEDKPFWVLFSPEGQIHLFGMHTHARVADPDNDSHIARWLMEETLTPTGEHIYYYWRSEDDTGCDESERSGHPDAGAQRYLARVSYGNIRPDAALMAVAGVPAEDAWLFHLVFDYGERDPSLQVAPGYHTSQPWRCRPDSFSRYEYGFELRTRRLCRQVLMFHRLRSLAGEAQPDEVPALVSRLILDYDLNARVSLLLSARGVAHEEDGKPVMQPPLELEYQRVDDPVGQVWHEAHGFGKMNAFQPWQLVDLYGEGLPGILWHDPRGAWWYQPPVRDTTAAGQDAVTYAAPEPLPAIPAQREGAMLMDVNGDGRLDWVVTHSGLRGYHSMQADQAWTSFIPLASVPTEYFHPSALLADISGAGLPDLALIGPKSVRVWQNNRQGWETARDAGQDNALPLPVPGFDARVMVGFSDMNGSGRSHLVQITADAVSYWPNLGHGKFGQPVAIPGFSITEGTFDPDRVYLADIDGSGTTDLLYAHGDHLALYVNESGNRFAGPLRLSLPEGVRFDDTCRLQIADVQGLGTGSVILTVPHHNVRHFCLTLTGQKPWLLNEINNNMGASTTLFYRSSAQFWLDEKSEAAAAGKTVTGYLPFPVHLLHRTLVLDEITGNRLSGHTEYAHGAWDGREREYRGFARVTQTDTDELANGSRGSDLPVPVALRRISWFATGLPEIDKLLPAEFWSGDTRAFPYLSPRFTRFNPDTQRDEAIDPDDEQAYWLHRALKGALLRQEVFGEDGSGQAGVPYNVSESRPQVRLLSAHAVMVFTGETREWVYERVIDDPQCHQTLLLNSDALGYPLAVLSIAYPRREPPAVSPYPDSLPETLFASSYDEQQHVLRLNLTRTSWHHLVHNDFWLPGLPQARRADARTFTAESMPAQGISLEWITGEGRDLLPGREQDYLGHESVHYLMEDDTPVYPPRTVCTETAEFDRHALTAFDGVFNGEELEEKLTAAGWISVPVPFSDNSNFRVWAGQHGFTDFAGPDGFYRPLAQRETLLTGKKYLTWDTHFCGVIREESPSGLRAEARYDYRFMTPISTLDANDNTTAVTVDAFGRVTSIRFWGLEEGVMSGYTSPEEEATPFRVAESVEQGLQVSPGIPVAGFIVYAPMSWMPADPGEASGNAYTGRLALKRYLRQYPGRSADMRGLLPPHTLNVTTDRYDSDPEQQLSQSLSFSDGFGRSLQTSVRHEAGEAWQLNEETSSLIVSDDGLPASRHTEFRWAISGRTEYDGKGRPYRTYLPYFLNSWRYVGDDSARQDLFADTTFYDAPGREVSVVTAAGWLRRTTHTPWFVVREDENDTASEILEKNHD
ncbi:TPA: SpvB/TcaC N-terminal domain-containing protein [Enterobacter cloacae]